MHTKENWFLFSASRCTCRFALLVSALSVMNGAGVGVERAASSSGRGISGTSHDSAQVHVVSLRHTTRLLYAAS